MGNTAPHLHPDLSIPDSELRCYGVPVREVFDRTAYVNASSRAEARKLALDPANWMDSDEPMGAGVIQGTKFPVSDEGSAL